MKREIVIQVDGQMDVFEIIDLVEREGIVPVSGNEKEPRNIVVGDFVDFADISAKPLWNRPSSPE